jgi:hypothetical protein
MSYYDVIDDSDYSDDYGYDPAEHMAIDLVDFQINGFAGAGYDTSHVKNRW